MGGSIKPEDILEFFYVFKLSDGTTKSFKVVLDEKTLDCISEAGSERPDWARLGYHQCGNCPLDSGAVQYCPIAVNVANLVGDFKDLSSYENALVHVMTRERDITKSTTVQEGLSSIMGIYMVTSGCPMMEKLKPLVRFHLPFATIEEHVVRVVSMYLFTQYFLTKKGREPDWELRKLGEIYDEITIVNEGISTRFTKASTKDANVTAVTNLGYVASLVPVLIDKTLEEIGDSFSSYLR